MPKASPSGFGLEAPPEPYAHFEAIRQAQKDAMAAIFGIFQWRIFHWKHQQRQLKWIT
jgi:hypothetical protein